MGWSRPLGLLGMVLGVDMVVLFVATAVGISALVLVTGGLASVVLGPTWWVLLTRILWTDSRRRWVNTLPLTTTAKGW